MTRWLLAFVLLSFLLLPSGAIQAASKKVCSGASCTAAEVGPFMQDVSADCGNTGTCSLKDIEQVFFNVGNWILGIVGSLVFLMYIWGGFNILVGGASAERVTMGKKTIKTATLGLIIVFIAFAGITTLKTALVGGGAEGGKYTACTKDNPGETCALNSICTSTGCTSKCDQYVKVDAQFNGFSCKDKSSSSSPTKCVPGLCPGASSIQCCP